MSRSDHEGSLRDLLVAEVPATVWSRSLDEALSSEGVDRGEELIPGSDAPTDDWTAAESPFGADGWTDTDDDVEGPA